MTIKRALISVSDKTNLIPFAQKLTDMEIELISTGGTSKALAEAGIPHRQVEELTGLSEMLGGRVKTLHPKIHGGILGRRDTQAEEAARHDIPWIDMVVVNFYPFTSAVTSDMPMDEAVEYIDIGGPTMVRAAAKNLAWVTVITDPADYQLVASILEKDKGLGFDLRKQLAEKAFALTSHYDAMVQRYFLETASDPVNGSFQTVQLKKAMDLRYGENPHQRAAAYQLSHANNGILSSTQHQGKPLSYNNLLDADAALKTIQEFEQPACVIVKHANPCGVAVSDTIDSAYLKAYEADSLSAFGGIIALNRECTKTIAEAVASIFMEIIIAPSFTKEALETLSAKPNLRVLSIENNQQSDWEMRFITGGVLMQERDTQRIREADLKVVTTLEPDQTAIQDMLFAWQVLKHIKSNGILIAKDSMTIGMGAGQVSRVDAVDIAIRKAGGKIQGTVLASDAFFPFRDSIDRLAGTGIRAIIQPGGSVRDEEVITACNEHGIAMVFTGKRCFRH